MARLSCTVATPRRCAAEVRARRARRARRWPTPSRQIVAAVRERRRRGAARVRGALRRRRARCASRATSSTRRSRRSTPPCARGSRSRSRTCARSPRPGSTPRPRRRCPQGQTRAAARGARSAAPRSTRPAGRNPYPSTVVMGAVTARAAGVDEVVVAARAHPVILAAARAVRGRRGVPRWAARRRSPRSPTAPRRSRPVDVIVGPGQPVGAGGQAPGRPARRHRRLRRAERPDRDRCPRAPTPSRCSSTCWRRPSTARARWSWRSATTRRCSTRSAAVAVEVLGRRHGRRAGLRRGARARAPAARGRGGRGARAARAPRGLPVRRQRGRHRVRRLRRGLQPHAADRRRRALRLRPVGARTSAAAWPRSAWAAPRPALARAGGADRAGRGLRPRTPRRWRSARIPARDRRTAEIDRQTGETDVSLALGLDGTGAGTRAHRRRLPRPHARPARPPRRGWTST